MLVKSNAGNIPTVSTTSAVPRKGGTSGALTSSAKFYGAAFSEIKNRVSFLDSKIFVKNTM